jgi:hypothetical protein
MAGNVGNSAMISREAAFQDSLAQRARKKCPAKSALKARDNSARPGPSNVGEAPSEPRLTHQSRLGRSLALPGASPYQ